MSIVLSSTFQSLNPDILKLRLKADVASSLTLDGANVTQWDDISGNSHHISSTGTERPQYEAAGLNSRPTVNFANSSDVGSFSLRAEHPAFKAYTGLTILCVMQWRIASDNGSAANDLGRVFGVGGFDTRQVLIGASGGFQSVMSFQYNASSASADAEGVSFQRMRASVGDNMVLGFATGDGQGSMFYVDGYATPPNRGTTSSDLNPAANYDPASRGVTGNWICVGGRLSNNTSGTNLRRLRAKISEYRVYNRNLTQAEIAQVSAEMASDWGLSLAPYNPTIAFAGQSNAQGRAEQASAPAAYQSAYTGSSIWFGTDAMALRLDPLTVATAQGDDTTKFGAEISMSRSIKDERGDNSVIKWAVGATSLAEDWKPTPTYGTQLQTFLDRCDQALNASVATGYQTAMEAFVWIQGERDSTDEDWANAYETNLRTLIQLVRSRYNYNASVIIPILPASLPVDSHPFSSTVVAAQRAVAASLNDVYLVETSGLLTPDDIHYDTDSYIALGEAISLAIRTRQNVTATLT